MDACHQTLNSSASTKHGVLPVVDEKNEQQHRSDGYCVEIRRQEQTARTMMTKTKTKKMTSAAKRTMPKKGYYCQDIKSTECNNEMEKATTTTTSTPPTREMANCHPATATAPPPSKVLLQLSRPCCFVCAAREEIRRNEHESNNNDLQSGDEIFPKWDIVPTIVPCSFFNDMGYFLWLIVIVVGLMMILQGDSLLKNDNVGGGTSRFFLNSLMAEAANVEVLDDKVGFNHPDNGTCRSFLLDSWMNISIHMIRLLKLLLLLSLIVFVSLIIICICNTYRQLYVLRQQEHIKQETRQKQYDDASTNTSIRASRERILSSTNQLHYAQTLSKAIQIPTISHDYTVEGQETSEEDGKKLLKLHDLLRESFPKLHKAYPPKLINKYSLVYCIPSKNNDNEKQKPILLCAHLDVVPAPNTQKEWTFDPFSGYIDPNTNIIWGRGAIDNKHNAIAMLGALEDLLEQDEVSLLDRSIYVAFGHDEEVGGTNGAAHIARYLEETLGNGDAPPFEFIIDEGTMMVSGALPGIDKHKHVAMISTSEKGYATIELSINGPGGHTSIPALDNNTNALAIMSRAIDRLESNPFPSHFESHSIFRTNLVSNMLHYKSLVYQVIFGNLWLLGPLLQRLLVTKFTAAAAMIRTTTATVKMEGGSKYNVMPTQVKAYINHRIHPSDTLEDVLTYDRKIINDSRIKVSLVKGQYIAPAPVSSSSYDKSPFGWIEDCIDIVYEGQIPSATSLMIGNTDTRWYWKLSKNIYRFSPVALTMEDTKMFHGINERISTKALAQMVLFYRTLIQQSAMQKRREM